MAEMKSDPVELNEPKEETGDRNIWFRGLQMIILAIFFAFAETILAICAVVQFFWMLFTKGRNEFISDFGKALSKWLAEVALFQTGTTDEKPFPWKKWG